MTAKFTGTYYIDIKDGSNKTVQTIEQKNLLMADFYRLLLNAPYKSTNDDFYIVKIIESEKTTAFFNTENWHLNLFKEQTQTDLDDSLPKYKIDDTQVTEIFGDLIAKRAKIQLAEKFDTERFYYNFNCDIRSDATEKILGFMVITGFQIIISIVKFDQPLELQAGYIASIKYVITSNIEDVVHIPLEYNDKSAVVVMSGLSKIPVGINVFANAAYDENNFTYLPGVATPFLMKHTNTNSGSIISHKFDLLYPVNDTNPLTIDEIKESSLFTSTNLLGVQLSNLTTTGDSEFKIEFTEDDVGKILSVTSFEIAMDVSPWTTEYTMSLFEFNETKNGKTGINKV